MGPFLCSKNVIAGFHAAYNGVETPPLDTHWDILPGSTRLVYPASLEDIAQFRDSHATTVTLENASPPDTDYRDSFSYACVLLASTLGNTFLALSDLLRSVGQLGHLTCRIMPYTCRYVQFAHGPWHSESTALSPSTL